MGCSAAALVRIWAAGRSRISPAFWPEALIDLLFATGNSCVGATQKLLLDRAVAKTGLTTDPIFIIGHWRTGTTLLHELLALDPRLRAPTTYECLAPHHFLLTGRWLPRWIGFTLPRMRPPDKMIVSWDSPQEDEFALCNLGVPSPYATIAFPNEPPANDAYYELDGLPPREQVRWEHAWLTFLQRLTYARPGRLALKSPTHTFRLPTLTRLFPAARFINMVRHPLAVFSSTLRLWRTMYATYGYQRPRFEGLEEYVLTMFIRMHQRLDATRALAAKENFLDLRYEDLVAAPVATVRSLYHSLSLGDFEPALPAIEKYLADRAGYLPQRHGLEECWREEVLGRWKPYFERYGYT